MKKFLTILAVSFMAAFVLGSCNKNDGPSYPSHLTGHWEIADASTGYQGILAITDIAGGQYAALEIFTPAGELDQEVEGSFVYDAATGQGTITSKLVGASTANIQVLTETDEVLAVSVTTVTSPASVHNYTATKMESVAFTTGTWKGDYIHQESNADTVHFELKVNSVSTSGDCGIITASSSDSTETGTVTGISKFIKRSDGTCFGFMKVAGVGEGTEPAVLPIISTSDLKTLTLYWELEDDQIVSVTLKKQ